MNSGHVARDCPSKYSCRKCNGKHHISICTTSSDDSKGANNVSTNISVSDGVLLQTASGEVTSPDGCNRLRTRFLFDSGSQRSYVTEQVSKRLNLKAVRSERIVTRTFGRVDSNVRKVDIVRLKAAGLDGNSVVFEAIVMPMICCPLTNQNIDVVTQKYREFEGIRLADYHNGNAPMEVGVLIGADFYASFFTGRVKKSTVGGPVGNESIFGWVLSGCYGDGSSRHVYCNEIHTMRCNTESYESDCDLRDQLRKFWNIESSTSEEERNVICDFERDIRFNGIRYETKLPF